MVFFLRYHSYTIKFTLLQLTIQWFVYIHKFMQPTLLIPEYFHHSLSNSAPSAGSHYFILHQPLLTYFLPSRTCLFWTFQTHGLIQHVIFCLWFLSLRLFSRLSHVGAGISKHSIPSCGWPNCIWFIHWAVGAPCVVSAFRLLRIMQLWAFYKLRARAYMQLS